MAIFCPKWECFSSKPRRFFCSFEMSTPRTKSFDLPIPRQSRPRGLCVCVCGRKVVERQSLQRCSSLENVQTSIDNVERCKLIGDIRTVQADIKRVIMGEIQDRCHYFFWKSFSFRILQYRVGFQTALQQASFSAGQQWAKNERLLTHKYVTRYMVTGRKICLLCVSSQPMVPMDNLPPRSSAVARRIVDFVAV